MTSDELAAPGLGFVFEARVAVGPPQDLGDVGKGGRRIVPITGGEFSGPQMRGEVLQAARIGRCCAMTVLPNWRRVTRCALPTEC
jgi:hypothetical protein